MNALLEFQYGFTSVKNLSEIISVPWEEKITLDMGEFNLTFDKKGIKFISEDFEDKILKDTLVAVEIYLGRNIYKITEMNYSGALNALSFLKNRGKDV